MSIGGLPSGPISGTVARACWVYVCVGLQIGMSNFALQAAVQYVRFTLIHVRCLNVHVLDECSAQKAAQRTAR
jgi:hypothetical protein